MLRRYEEMVRMVTSNGTRDAVPVTQVQEK